MRGSSTTGLKWKACVLTNPTKPLTLVMLSADAKLAEIKRLYYQATKQTIQQDLTKALDLLKSMANEDERERAAVYMDGLSQMRSDWARKSKNRKVKS